MAENPRLALWLVGFDGVIPFPNSLTVDRRPESEAENEKRTRRRRKRWILEIKVKKKWRHTCHGRPLSRLAKEKSCVLVTRTNKMNYKAPHPKCRLIPRVWSESKEWTTPIGRFTAFFGLRSFCWCFLGTDRFVLLIERVGTNSIEIKRKPVWWSLD